MNKPPEVLQDFETLRADLYKLNERLCEQEKITGAEVINLLKEVSEDVCTAGIDGVFREAKLKNADNLMNVIDLCWLAVLAVKINNHRTQVTIELEGGNNVGTE